MYLFDETVSILFVVQYHPAAPPAAIWDSFSAINQKGLTEQQQSALEVQIETASMEQINYRVGGFPVGADR